MGRSFHAFDRRPRRCLERSPSRWAGRFIHSTVALAAALKGRPSPISHQAGGAGAQAGSHGFNLDGLVVSISMGRSCQSRGAGRFTHPTVALAASARRAGETALFAGRRGALQQRREQAVPERTKQLSGCHCFSCERLFLVLPQQREQQAGRQAGGAGAQAERLSLGSRPQDTAPARCTRCLMKDTELTKSVVTELTKSVVMAPAPCTRQALLVTQATAGTCTASRLRIP